MNDSYPNYCWNIWWRKNVLKGLNCLTLWTMSLAVLMPFAAQAGDAESCEAYAKAAMEQVSIGQSNPACARGMDGPLWSPELRVHFSYCINNPIDVVEGGIGKRNEYLRSCGAIH